MTRSGSDSAGLSSPLLVVRNWKTDPRECVYCDVPLTDLARADAWAHCGNSMLAAPYRSTSRAGNSSVLLVEGWNRRFK
eukprot:1853475-Prymnesium_polylepis.1